MEDNNNRSSIILENETGPSSEVVCCGNEASVITSKRPFNLPLPNNNKEEISTVKWSKIEEAPYPPRPRHGHRAISCENFMLVFGGGTEEGITGDLHIFDISRKDWFQPTFTGEIPQGRAGFGMAMDGERLLIHGGLTEDNCLSDQLYELNIPNWEWKRLRPSLPQDVDLPCGRLGHSFTMIWHQIYLFGGMTNDGDWMQTSRYLNDLFVLHIRLCDGNGLWDVPDTFGVPPCPRESHTTVGYTSELDHSQKLIVFGGKGAGRRLGDVHIFTVDTKTWCQPDLGGGVPPAPRTLHTANMVGNRMYIFGGLVQTITTPEEEGEEMQQAKCSNSLACLNADTLSWESLEEDKMEELLPRAGHSAAVVNNKIIIFSGKDDLKLESDIQVCLEDLWKLEVKVEVLKENAPGMEANVTNQAEWEPEAATERYSVGSSRSDSDKDATSISKQLDGDPSSPSQPILRSLLNDSGYGPSPPVSRSSSSEALTQAPVPSSSKAQKSSTGPPPPEEFEFVRPLTPPPKKKSPGRVSKAYLSLLERQRCSNSKPNSQTPPPPPSIKMISPSTSPEEDGRSFTHTIHWKATPETGSEPPAPPKTPPIPVPLWTPTVETASSPEQPPAKKIALEPEPDPNSFSSLSISASSSSSSSKPEETMTFHYENSPAKAPPPPPSGLADSGLSPDPDYIARITSTYSMASTPKTSPAHSEENDAMRAITMLADIAIADSANPAPVPVPAISTSTCAFFAPSQLYYGLHHRRHSRSARGTSAGMGTNRTSTPLASRRGVVGPVEIITLDGDEDENEGKSGEANQTNLKGG